MQRIYYKMASLPFAGMIQIRFKGSSCFRTLSS